MELSPERWHNSGMSNLPITVLVAPVATMRTHGRGIEFSLADVKIIHFHATENTSSENVMHAWLSTEFFPSPSRELITPTMGLTKHDKVATLIDRNGLSWEVRIIK